VFLLTYLFTFSKAKVARYSGAQCTFITALIGQKIQIGYYIQLYSPYTGRKKENKISHNKLRPK